jgi:hypothetical protein
MRCVVIWGYYIYASCRELALLSSTFLLYDSIDEVMVLVVE